MVRKRIDLHGALDIGHGFGAGERVAAIDIHGAGAADAFAAGAAEGQRRVNGILDPDQCAEDHRAALAGIDLIRIDPRIPAAHGIRAIDAVFAQVVRARGGQPGLAIGDLRVPGQVKLHHRHVPTSGVD